MEVLVLRRPGPMRCPRGTIIGVYPDFKCREKLGRKYLRIYLRGVDYNKNTYLEDASHNKKNRPFFFKFWRLPKKIRKELYRKLEIHLSSLDFFKLVRERKWR